LGVFAFLAIIYDHNYSNEETNTSILTDTSAKFFTELSAGYFSRMGAISTIEFMFLGKWRNEFKILNEYSIKLI